jgi:hypothetical protein
MKILQRVAKLEHSGILAVTAPVLERFKTALDEAAHRLMGASFDSFKHDPAAQDRIVEDVTSGLTGLMSPCGSVTGFISATGRFAPNY